jgi:hypothetical protein
LMDNVFKLTVLFILVNSFPEVYEIIHEMASSSSAFIDQNRYAAYPASTRLS